MPAENPIDTLPTEVLALVPLTPEDRFLRHDQINIFACHMNNLPRIRSLFEKFNPAESGDSFGETRGGFLSGSAHSQKTYSPAVIIWKVFIPREH